MKKIQITKSQLKQLINEEANRYRKVLELEKKKKEILKQLSELYEMDYGMEPEVDEGAFANIFNKGKDMLLGSREELKAKYLKWIENNQRNWPDAGIHAPEGADLEAAIDAIRINGGDVRVTKKNGKWVPISHITSDVGSGFDGSGMGE